MSDEKIELLEKEIAELKTELAILNIKQQQLIQKLDGFTSGVNRGLWILGGGFLTAVVVWVTGGGLSGQ